MGESKIKWLVSISLLIVLTLVIGVNSALLSPNAGQGQVRTTANKNAPPFSRSIASATALLGFSWEKKAFSVLERARKTDLSHVGAEPQDFDQFAFGDLAGHYSIRRVDGRITQVQFAKNLASRPKILVKRQNFLAENLGLFSKHAKSVEKIHVENDADRVIERFQLTGDNGQSLGVIQVLLDKDQHLLSMTVH